METKILRSVDFMPCKYFVPKLHRSTYRAGGSEVLGADGVHTRLAWRSEGV